jgi:hypothetical protein
VEGLVEGDVDSAAAVSVEKFGVEIQSVGVAFVNARRFRELGVSTDLYVDRVKSPILQRLINKIAQVVEMLWVTAVPTIDEVTDTGDGYPLRTRMGSLTKVRSLEPL